ncbi:MAG: ANTAR domain-containing protein, partial [Pseudomonadota bacterium]
MKQRKCSEDEAYHTLRKMAMKQNIQIAEVAKKVISLEELLA